MTLDEIISQVTDITARLDKSTYMRGIINSTCRSIASRVKSSESLVEEVLTIPRDRLIHNITLSDMFIAAEYLRPLPFNFVLKPIVPSKAVLHGRELVNVYYRAGKTLIVRLATGFNTDQLAFGWYSAPPILNKGTDTNWITLHYPELLIAQLAYRVFTSVGDFDSAKAQQQAAAILFAEFENQQSNAGTVAIQGKL